MDLIRAKKALLGRPLATEEARHEKLPKWKALATLSSDALSSVAYATDATLVTLLAFSAAALVWSVPIALAIVCLLIILTASYRQTIQAYPSGGGAYTVAKENLGVNAGLVAGAALMIDYVLTVAVSVASGIENIASAFPWLLQHKEAAGAIVVGLIMIMNLRGIRESATIFAFPTYFFIASVLILIGGGIWRVSTGQAAAPPLLTATTFPAVPLFLVLRAFASGCSALTGVEAISNGVSVFRDPQQRNAKITLIIMAALLGLLFLGISSLSHLFHVVPVADQTVMSLLGRAVFGATLPYYFIQVATALILFLAANTSYADFPRLASLMARDRYLPRQLGSMGDRLVFSNGVIWLSLFATYLIFVFKGNTIRMLPLYAVGVFLSFTLSQTGMIVHHLRLREPKWRYSLAMNALGAATTLLVLLDIGLSKFTHGAWIVILALPLLVLLFRRIHRHYLAASAQLTLAGMEPSELKPIRHLVLVPLSGIHRGLVEALRYAVSISDDVHGVYVESDPARTDSVKAEWQKWAPHLPLVILHSPYRSILRPLIHYIDEIKEKTPDEYITVVVPEFVANRWWQNFLHNQTGLFLKASLHFKRRVVVTTVRYHLSR